MNACLFNECLFAFMTGKQYNAVEQVASPHMFCSRAYTGYFYFYIFENDIMYM